jgi:peptide/nickel transport system ATP-binding protein
MSELLLEIKNLSVVYETDEDTVKAVNGIDLAINRGETLGLVGETGAGKTTTALSIMRILPHRIGRVTGGIISLDGTNILQQPEAMMRSIRGARAAMIFQDPMTSLNPVLTVGDQIAEVVKLHTDLDRTQVERRLEEMLELVGIPPQRKNDYPHQFSGGMKQRVVIAIALACDPELLIADEPTTALDVTIQAQVLEMMRELKEKLNTSMMLITHDLGVVAETCDRVAIMYAGEIIESGTVEDIYEGKDHHPYTAGLFGSIPDLTQRTTRLNPIPGLMPDPTDLPEGCKFHPRCPRCMEHCKTVAPPVYEAKSHQIRCHLFSGGH